MPVQHDAVAALPVATDAVKQLVRDLLVKRMAYALTDAEDSQDLIAVNPTSGATILVLIQNGRVFQLDPLDTTTVHDGTTCLVSSEGKRYKIDTFVVPFSVIDKDLTAPPSPAASIGDAYLLNAPGTGAWTGLGPIVVLTSHGWEEVEAPVGFLIFVEDEDAYYHIDSGGNVVPGMGISSIAHESLYPIHLLRGGDLVHWLVINQTTTVPPSSPAPSEGDTYIAAVASTGAWTGWDGSIVRFEGGSWRRYTPATGWRATDVSTSTVYSFSSPNWVSQAGAMIYHDYVYTADATGVTTLNAGPNYVSTLGTAPTTALDAQIDTAGLTRAARKIGAKLRFKYQFAQTTNNAFVVGLFRDAEANAVQWYESYSPGSDLCTMGPYEFLIEAADIASHTYHIRIVEIAAVGHPGIAGKRLFQIEEFA